jgi:hypothetical protein
MKSCPFLLPTVRVEQPPLMVKAKPVKPDQRQHLQVFTVQLASQLLVDGVENPHPQLLLDSLCKNCLAALLPPRLDRQA